MEENPLAAGALPGPRWGRLQRAPRTPSWWGGARGGLAALPQNPTHCSRSFGPRLACPPLQKYFPRRCKSESKLFPRRRPLPGGAGRPKLNQLEMVNPVAAGGRGQGGICPRAPAEGGAPSGRRGNFFFLEKKRVQHKFSKLL